MKHFLFTLESAQTAPTVRKLAALNPETLAIMHGSSFSGQGKPVLKAMAAFYEGQLQAG